MKGAASKILIALGILLILAAILWWAIAVNAMVKLSDSLDFDLVYEGEVTTYVNPATGERLAEGSELKSPIRVELEFVPDKGEFSSSSGVLDGTFTTSIQGMPEQNVESVYVLDRKTMENVNDQRALSYKYEYTGSDGAEQVAPGVTVNREGTYYPLLPMDTPKDETYMFWKEEIADAFELEYVSEEEKEGVTVYNFKGSYEEREAAAAYVESMARQIGLPLEISFDQVKSYLSAEGMDVDGTIPQATQGLSPEELQAFNQALQEPFPLKYYWSQDFEVSVEPKSGGPVDVYRDVETLSAKVDLTRLGVVQGLQSMIDRMQVQKVFEYNVEQTDESVKVSVDDAKDAAGSINLVKVYIPWALLIVGALILIIGLLIGGAGAPLEEE